MQHVIVGNSAAGIFAAEEIRRRRPYDAIVMLSDENYPAYCRCLTSYYLSGKVREQGMYLRPGSFYNDQGINLLLGKRVVEIDLKNARVHCRDGSSIPYDKLLIASGASPVLPSLPGVEAKGIYCLRTLDDAKYISDRAALQPKAVVVGGGLVSLKAAYGLLQRSLKVTVVVSSSKIMSQTLDAVSAGLLQKWLEKHGMKFIMNANVVEFRQDREGVSGVVLADQTKLNAKLVIIGKGVSPNTGFLQGQDISVHKGIVVNEYLETSVPGIFAAGDVAETVDLLRNNRVINAIWPNATEQGEIAGGNMAGGQVRYRGSVNMNSANFFGLSVISVGLYRREEGEGFEVLTSIDREGQRYVKLVFAGDCLVGYVLFGENRRAGTLTSLITAQAHLSSWKKKEVIADIFG